MDRTTTTSLDAGAGDTFRHLWFDAKTYGRPQGVNRDKGTILGCSVATVGPALGHNVHLDEEFMTRVAELGNAEPGGLKARFGHPTMCSTALGTFLGRWKTFTVENGRVTANLHLSNSARKTPHGNLYEYVLSLAEKDSDMFGVSIVFTRGEYYKRDRDRRKVICRDLPDGVFGWYDAEGKPVAYSEDRDGPLYVECADLHAADAVDEPAANPTGLFSRWTRDTVAAQVTEFLDTHPEVLEIMSAHPEVVADFQARYQAHLRRKQGAETMADTPAAAPAAPPAPTETVTASAAETVPAAIETPTDTATGTAPAADAAPALETAAPAAPPPEPPTVTLAELGRLACEYGAEIAVKAILSGGGERAAVDLAIEAKRQELAALSAQASGKAAAFVPQDTTEKLTLEDFFKPKRK